MAAFVKWIRVEGEFRCCGKAPMYEIALKAIRITGLVP
jgi:hypothetical protein